MESGCRAIRLPFWQVNSRAGFRVLGSRTSNQCSLFRMQEFRVYPPSSWFRVTMVQRFIRLRRCEAAWARNINHLALGFWHCALSALCALSSALCASLNDFYDFKELNDLHEICASRFHSKIRRRARVVPTISNSVTTTMIQSGVLRTPSFSNFFSALR